MVLKTPRFTIVVCLVLGSSVSAQTVQDEHPERVDIQGDPLPEGVAVRCGTVRYRHPGWYKQVDFLPGTHHFVVSPKGYSPMIWDAASGKVLRRFDHSGGVACVRVVPNSNDVAMLTWDINNETRMCRAWFTMPRDGGGRQLRWKEPFTKHSVKFALSPDAHTLAVGTYHGMLTFRSLETGKELNSESVIDGEVSWIDWSPRGDRIAVAGRRGAAILKWDSAKQQVEILTRIKRAQVVRFSHDGSLLAVGSERSGAATIWDARTGELIRQIGNVDDDYYREGLCFSSDDSVLYVPYNYRKQVEEFDVKTGELRRSFQAPRTPPRAVDISDDGKFLVSVGSESQIAVWDLTTGELISDRFPGHAEHAGDLTFMPDGKKLVSGDSRGVIRVWDTQTGTHLNKFEHDHWVTGLNVSPVGDQIVSLGLDETVRTWQLNPPRQVLKSEGHGGLGGNGASAAAFTSNGKECLSFGNDFRLARHDLTTQREVKRIEIRPSVLDLKEGESAAEKFKNRPEFLNVFNVQFDRTRSRLMIGVAGAVCGYDTATGEEVFKYAPDIPVHRFALSPDGSLLAAVKQVAAAAPEQPRLQILDIVALPAKKVLHTVVIPDFSWHLKFANDSRTLALCCGDWRPAKSRVFLQLLDARSGELGVRIPVGEFQIHQLAFSPDDQRIATSHTNTEIRIWNLADFKPKH